MRSEFLIPFEFDTGPIERKLEESGYEEIWKGLVGQCEDGLLRAFPGTYYNQPRSIGEVDWRRFAEKAMEGMVAAHLQEVVDEAALLLAMRASRKKAWREVLEEYRAERGDDGADG